MQLHSMCHKRFCIFYQYIYIINIWDVLGGFHICCYRYVYFHRNMCGVNKSEVSG